MTPDRLSRWNHIRHRAGLEDLTKEQAVAVWANMTEESKKESMGRLGFPGDVSEPHVVSDPNSPEAQAYAEQYWANR